MLYGLDRLDAARENGYVVLVEGPSDCHTLWFYDIPAIGAPSASTFKPEWAAYFDGIPVIFVVIEPDKGGESLLLRISKTSLADRLKLLDFNPFKDPSAVYLDSPKEFRDRCQCYLDRAVHWADHKRIQATAKAAAAMRECTELARKPNILECFMRDMAERGVAGERRTASLIYLAVTSRFLDRPVSIAVKGPSSGGKSFLVEQTLAYFPTSAYYARSGMSERALAYSEEPLKHRMLVIYEAAGMTGDFMTYLIRSLLSEGRVSYETVEKTKDGMRPRVIEKEGPTGLIVTTTLVSLHPENETRLLSLSVNDDRKQTAAVLLAIARGQGRPANLNEWHALQEWLSAAEHRVTIQYAVTLAGKIPSVAVRLRRDFTTLLALIKAHAILHQATREQDETGAIVASIDDYAAVRELVADLMGEGVQSAVSPTIRETVQTVANLCNTESATVSNTQLAAALKLDTSATSRRVAAAIKEGWLVNHEPTKGKRAKIVLGEPLPEDRPLLPEPAELADNCTVAQLQELIHDPRSPACESDRESLVATIIAKGQHLGFPSLSWLTADGGCEGWPSGETAWRNRCRLAGIAELQAAIDS
jgi:hypothetical protein